MSAKEKAKLLIKTLKSKDFHAECSNCGDSFLLKKADLFYNDDFTFKALKIYEDRLIEIKKIRSDLKNLKEEIPIHSQRTTKATNLGLILERLAPTLEGFNLDHADCRSLFDPIDYIVFNGLNKNSYVDSLVFMEVKSGEARLTDRQKTIRRLVDDGKVEFQIY